MLRSHALHDHSKWGDLVSSWTFGLSHIAMKVADLDRSVRFYREAFGVQARHQNSSTAMLFGLGSADLITLVLEPNSAGVAGGIEHFDLRLTDPEHFDDWKLFGQGCGGADSTKAALEVALEVIGAPAKDREIANALSRGNFEQLSMRRIWVRCKSWATPQEHVVEEESHARIARRYIIGEMYPRDLGMLMMG